MVGLSCQFKFFVIEFGFVETHVDGGEGIALGERGEIIAVEPDFGFEDRPGCFEDAGDDELGVFEGDLLSGPERSGIGALSSASRPTQIMPSRAKGPGTPPPPSKQPWPRRILLLWRSS